MGRGRWAAVSRSGRPPVPSSAAPPGGRRRGLPRSGQWPRGGRRSPAPTPPSPSLTLTHSLCPSLPCVQVLLFTHIAPRLPLSPQEVATCDLLCQSLCLQALSASFDSELDVVERSLLYAALLQSEKADDLREAERLLTSAMRGGPAVYRPFIRQLLARLEHYRGALSRFGRIPHLNARRGRRDTEEEAEWKRARDWQLSSAGRGAVAAGRGEGGERTRGKSQSSHEQRAVAVDGASSTSPPPHRTPLPPSASSVVALRWPRADG